MNEGREILNVLGKSIDHLIKGMPLERDWDNCKKTVQTLLNFYTSLTPEERIIFDKGRLVGRYDTLNYICWKFGVKG